MNERRSSVRGDIIEVLDCELDLRPAVDTSEIEWKRGMLIRGPVALPVTW